MRAEYSKAKNQLSHLLRRSVLMNITNSVNFELNGREVCKEESRIRLVC